MAACAIVGFASATSAGAATIGVSSFSPQFVGVDLAKATIVSDADSASANTSWVRRPGAGSPTPGRRWHRPPNDREANPSAKPPDLGRLCRASLSFAAAAACD